MRTEDISLLPYQELRPRSLSILFIAKNRQVPILWQTGDVLLLDGRKWVCLIKLCVLILTQKYAVIHSRPPGQATELRLWPCGTKKTQFKITRY